jgi:hypothetical protein
MIIIYDKANTLNLPYSDKDGAVNYKMFVPGRNDVESEIWDAIKEYNEKNFDHYGRFLGPVNEEAAGDGPINYAALNVKELSVLIENTMDIGQLGDIEAAEKSREKGERKSVLKEIENQINKLAAFDKKIEDEKEKENN